MTGQNLPPPQSPFVDDTRNLSYDGYQYLLSLLNATSATTATVATGLKATGNNQATALLLSDQWNEVDSVANAGAGVLLASYQPGQSQVVANVSGASIAVYPPPGMQIDSLGVNDPYTLSNGTRVTFEFFSSVQIRS